MDQQAQDQSGHLALMALFARMDTIAIAIAAALVSAMGLAAATAVLLLSGAPPGVPIGPNLSALSNLLPGYSVSWLGCLVGAAWAAVIGSIAGFFAATCWNFVHIVFLGAAALSYEPRNGSRLGQERGLVRPVAADSADRYLLSKVVRMNILISALGVGLSLGLLLFLTTMASIAVSNLPGRYLNLLGVFMPGYSASPRGAWFGLFWGLVYGALSGGAVAWLYARSLGARLPELVKWDDPAVRRLRLPVLRLSSHALGITLGILAALQLVLATLWLVVRGTAGQSVHARLLSHYLPGYTVSWQGSLVAGLELFVLIYLFSALTGGIYNFIVDIRGKGERR
jgi:hypothetical protein